MSATAGDKLLRQFSCRPCSRSFAPAPRQLWRSHTVNHVFRQLEVLTEDIQNPVAANEAHYEVRSLHRLGKLPSRKLRRKHRFYAARLHRLHWSPAFKRRVVIPAVMPNLELLTHNPQIFHSVHVDAPIRLVVPVVIELLDSSVTPRLPDRDEDRLHTVEPAQPDKLSHGVRMQRTAVERHLVVDLRKPRYSKAIPYIPDRLDQATFTHQRLNATTSGDHIQGVQAVKLDRSFQIAGTDKVIFVDIVRANGRKLRIELSLRFVSTSSLVSQITALQDALDRGRRWNALFSIVFQPPADRFRPTELSGVIETESGDPNDFLNLTRRSLRTKLRVTRTILEPIFSSGLVPLQPLVEPFAGMSQSSANGSDGMVSQSLLDSMDAFFFLFGAHTVSLREQETALSITANSYQ